MKKTFILTILIVCTFCVHSQNKVKFNEITYIEGTDSLKEYPMKVDTIKVPAEFNGHGCPILSYFYENKKNYIGGIIKIIQ